MILVCFVLCYSNIGKRSKLDCLLLLLSSPHLALIKQCGDELRHCPTYNIDTTIDNLVIFPGEEDYDNDP